MLWSHADSTCFRAKVGARGDCFPDPAGQQRPNCPSFFHVLSLHRTVVAKIHGRYEKDGDKAMNDKNMYNSDFK